MRPWIYSALGGGAPLVNPVQTNIVAEWIEGQGLTLAGALVTQWDDASGLAHHYTQTGAERPDLQGDNSILFNGTADYLKAVFAQAQPTTTYMVVKQVTSTNGDRITNGGDQDIGIKQTAVSGQISFVNNTAANSDWPLDTYAVITVVLNGASSAIRVNTGTATTGNAGATAPGGDTIGAAYTGGAPASIQVKTRRLVYSVAHDGTTQDLIITWLAGLAGISLGLGLMAGGDILLMGGGRLLLMGA